MLRSLRKLFLVVRFEFSGTISFVITLLIQLLIIPIILASMVYFLLSALGVEGSLRLAAQMYLVVTLASTIHFTAAFVAEIVTPDVKDLLVSLYGDVRLAVINKILMGLIYVIPQVMIVSILLRDSNIVVYSLIAYLFTASLGTFIGVVTREHFKAETIGLLIYLLLVMAAPLYLYTDILPLKFIPLSILSGKDIVFAPYTIALAALLLWISLRKC